MQETTCISDSGRKRLYIRQRMQETLYQTADAGDYIRQRMQVSLYQTTDARDSISDSECRSLYIRQRMQETLSHSGSKRLYLTADARECIRQDARDYIRQDAGVSISDSGCRSLYIRQRKQETLYQTGDARDSI